MASYEAIYQHLVARYSGDDVYAFFQRHERDVIRRYTANPNPTDTDPRRANWLRVILPLPVSPYDTPAAVRTDAAAWAARFPDVTFELVAYTDPVTTPRGQHELMFTGPEVSVTLLLMDVVMQASDLTQVQADAIIKDVLTLLRQDAIPAVGPVNEVIPPNPTTDPVLHDPHVIARLNADDA